MIKIDLGYRTIEELTEKWGCSNQDIFEWGAHNLLKIWKKDNLRISLKAEPLDILDIHNISYGLSLERDNSVDWLNSEDHPFKELILNVEREHAITNKEIQRFEEKHKEKGEEETKKKQKSTKNKILSPTQDPETDKNTPSETLHINIPKGHDYIPKELPIAIHCWNALFKDRDTDALKTPGGYTEMITDWLKDHYEEECKKSKSFIGRITTIVMPQKGKSGGAAPTGL